MAIEHKDLASALLKERQLRGLTQVEAARELGVLQQTYANWELGGMPRVHPAGTTGARAFATTVQSLGKFLALSPLEVLRLALTPDLGSAEHDLVTAYRERIEELQHTIEQMKVGQQN